MEQSSTLDQKVADIFANLPDFVVRDIDREALLHELTSGKDIQPVGLPRIYQMETTSRCNLACPFCPRTTDLVAHGKRDLNATMPLGKFIDILDRMPWLRSIELFHFGEPFMHKDLEKYVQACTDRGIYTVIASNLLPATPEKVDKVFAAGLGFLVMDVDSLDHKRYATMRVNGNLELLQRRVKYILGHASRPYTVAQTIMLDGVQEYSEAEFLEWTGGLKADELRYKFLDSFRGEIVEDKGVLGPDDICREPFYGFTVHVNGNVVPCDRDWAGEFVMGNLFEQSVEEIWNGPKYREFREAMKSPNKPSICVKCEEGKLFNARSQPHIQVNQFRGAEVQG